MNGSSFSYDWEFHGSKESIADNLGIQPHEGWFLMSNATVLVVYDDETEMWWAFAWEGMDPRTLIKNVLNLPAFEFRSMTIKGV